MARRKRGSLRPLAGVALAPLLALVAAGAILAADRETGLLPLARIRDAVEARRSHVRDLELERTQLTRQIRRLRSDPFAIEQAAREELGMLRPGELVVRWPEAGLAVD